MKKKAAIIRINTKFAEINKLPEEVIATSLRKTERGAVYVYGENIDQWLPISKITIVKKNVKEIEIPDNHKMLKNPVKKSKGKTAIQENDRILINFPFDWDTLRLVKGLEGRKFNPKTKKWDCPSTYENIKTLHKAGFMLSKSLIDLIDISSKKGEEKPVKRLIQPTNLKYELYEYQKEGVAFIEKNNGRALIADEMGLGKTVQALGWIALHREHSPNVIICPASLKYNWQKEAKKWIPGIKTEILEGGKPYAPQINTELFIINYDILPKWLDALLSWELQIIVADEVHYIKNAKANRTKAAKKLIKYSPYFIALSGTPITNRPVEFYNTLKMIDMNCVPDYYSYVYKYCGAKNNGFGLDVSGATNIEELHQRINGTVMIRRLKKNVLKDLPAKTRGFIPLEITNRQTYSAAERDFISYIQKTKGDEAAEKASNAEMFAKLEGLKQLTIEGKMDSVIQWVRDFLESGEKLIIFATHKFTINRLEEEFGNIAVKVDGSVTKVDRQMAVEAFQTDNSVKLFLGNIKAAGVGLTLTAASNVAILEFPHTPGDLIQAEDRAHRIGQKEAVNIHYLLAENTIDETMANTIDEKDKIISGVLDGRSLEAGSMLNAIIENLNDKE